MRALAVFARPRFRGIDQEITTMQRSSTLLALALGISLSSPAVWAQGASGKTIVKATDAKVAVDLKNPAPPAQGGWWKAADVNADGKLSIAESTANAGLSGRFSQIDSNKDGFVTSDEYRVFYTSNASKGEAHAAAHSSVVTKDLWVTLDANADTRISLAEAKSSADLTGAFTDIDVDSDGFISQVEYRAYAKTNK